MLILGLSKMIFTGGFAQNIPAKYAIIDNRELPLYPTTLDDKPDIPSPYSDRNGSEFVIVCTHDDRYTVMPATVENGDPLNYRQGQWYGKGRQLEVDAYDFPTLAKTGIHSEIELEQTKLITEKSVTQINLIGYPGKYSGAGFMGNDEDVISVMMGDNRYIKRLGLTHPRMSEPLFHVFNIILNVKTDSHRGNVQAVIYNGRKISLGFWGAKGWQESIFDDEILGYWEIEMQRELDEDEQAFLSLRYPHLSEDDMASFKKRLSCIHTGEMAAYYSMRYGFYEGHTDYRADPIAIAFIFGLKSIEAIEGAFPAHLPEALNARFTRTENHIRKRVPGNQDYHYHNDVDACLENIKSPDGYDLSGHGELNQDQVMEVILDAFDDERWWIRRESVQALKDVGSERIVVPLVELLGDPEPRVSDVAIPKLIHLGPLAVGPLVDALKRSQIDQRIRAALVLGTLRSEAAVKPLLEMLNDDDRMVRDEAAVALSRIGSSRSEIPLIRILEERIRTALVEAIWVLGELKSEKAVNALIELLDEEEIGWMAALSLGKIGSHKAINPLIHLLVSNNVRQRRAAVWALDRIQSHRCAAHLRQALADSDLEVRMLARLALEHL